MDGWVGMGAVGWWGIRFARSFEGTVFAIVVDARGGADDVFTVNPDLVSLAALVDLTSGIEWIPWLCIGGIRQAPHRAWGTAQ